MKDLETTNLKAVVLDGYIVMYKQVSLCDLRDHVDFVAKFGKSVYQVHSDNAKYKCSDIYYNISDAVNRFLEVKRAIR
jgi:hypothetical protein